MPLLANCFFLCVKNMRKSSQFILSQFMVLYRLWRSQKWRLKKCYTVTLCEFVRRIYMCLCRGMCRVSPLLYAVYTTPSFHPDRILKRTCGCGLLVFELCICVWVCGANNILSDDTSHMRINTNIHIYKERTHFGRDTKSMSVLGGVCHACGRYV